MTVLILGGSDDEHALHVLACLRQRGADAEVLDSLTFPHEMQISFDPCSRSFRLDLASGRSISSQEVRSVYWRRYDGVAAPENFRVDEATIAYYDTYSLFETLLFELSARWVNSWSAVRLHQTKPVQLAMVAALGIKIPATIVTNRSHVVTEFAARYLHVIFKPVQDGAHARELTLAHLTSQNLQKLRISPVTLQEKVPGTNIRVFVAGDRVMACEVETEHLDFRDDPAPKLRSHSLDAAMSDTCRQIARRLGLLWTGIDFKKNENGYVFLEANPSPMFLQFESSTGLPITDSLIALLL